MASGAEGAGAAERASASLPDDVISSILLRLPPRPLGRCRAVCKAWRGLLSDRVLLLAHHRLQPVLPLLCSHRNVVDEDVFAQLMALHHYCLEAVELRAAQPPRVIVRFKDSECIPHPDGSVFDALEVHGSCDGLLLLNHLDAFFVCNPTTRQWARLPPLLRASHVAGFYAHAPSGEYRVLHQGSVGDETEYYVLTVGSQQARSIERRASSAPLGDALARGLDRAGTIPPVLLCGSLHWPPQWLLQENIVVFDTAAEVFRSMTPPVKGGRSYLFEMEGKLALSCCDQGAWSADLWIMQDYNSESWVLTRQVEVPVANRVGNDAPWDATIVSQEGDMLVKLNDRVLHYDSNGELLQTFDCDGPLIYFTRHMLKESLVPHPFFQRQQDGDTDGPPFFRGL
ncbi:hypothetical protein ACP70R_017333 [Stipagrostis hirtigluma subsp. patula]